METQRVFLAIFLSLAILLGYQYFSPAPTPPVTETVVAPGSVQDVPADGEAASPVAPSSVMAPAPGAVQGPAAAAGPAREVTVGTDRYTAVLSEAGGVLKSFRLKEYREDLAADSGDKEMLRPKPGDALPLQFSWGVEPAAQAPVTYQASPLSKDKDGQGLLMRALLANGLELTRTIRFSEQQYLMELTMDVRNTSAATLQGAPYLTLDNRPFSATNGMTSVGPSLLLDGVREELADSDLKKGSRSFTGKITWAAYQDSYFFCGIVPLATGQHTAQYSLSDENRVSTVLAGAAETIAPGQSRQYRYAVYLGPKTMDALKAAGHELERSINFGWFDFMAKPTLYLLKFLYGFVGNYGVAVILVTVLIKLLFWPISQKGMKSMKTMQKLQPKMAKLKEKYKDDKQMQQQEMIKLYQTYKVNPVSGCLPMLIQIPVFFALYKVLLQTIELRHAPFFLWITDLSAPDRLPIGFDIPFLGGIPVLTLLMGASMFLQQKMTPATGDPTQQKVMMFMPVIFTFMFLNFASGLVLYWFVNNLLSIGQQYLINREPAA